MTNLRTHAPFLLLIITAAALCRGPSHASACGSSSFADLGVLRPVTHTVSSMRYIGDTWGNEQREAFRFLHPFHLDDPTGTDLLWRFSHEQETSATAPSTAKLDAAIAAGKWSVASTEAKQVIDEVLALPPVIAADHRALLDRAVEIIELEPHLAPILLATAHDYLAQANPSSWPPELLRAHQARIDPAAAIVAGHPREGTLGFLALERDFRDTVPDGWSDAIRKQVPNTTWNRLLANTETWLLANLTHPLRDLAVLHQVRIHYFAGTTDDAWTILIDLLPRRKVRALAEMRYLLLTGHPPGDAQIDGLTDPRLITALAVPERVTPARWRRWWALSRQQRSEAWSVNLQERLLLWAATTGKTLPVAFPKQQTPPSSLWGKLRAAALLKVGLAKAAHAQLALVTTDAEQARLAAHAFLQRKRHVEAASLAGIDEDARRYLIEILMTDAELTRLAKTASPLIAKQARLEQGIRLTAQNQWTRAAKLIASDDPDRADLWRRIAGLVSRADKRLELARVLAAHRDEVFQPPDHGWYRGLSHRVGELNHRGHHAEARRIASHFVRSSARWRALVLTTQWLDDHETDPDARSVLSEADDYYNRLINQGGGNSYFWGEHTKSSPEVAALRAVGKRIRVR